MSPAPIPLGPFVLHGVVGRGALAEVWHGVHRRQSLPVAVKVIKGRGARDPERAALIRAEAQAVARLHHPGIVVVLDHGEVGADAESASGGLIPAGSPYIAMELAARGTLREAPGRLAFADVKAVLLALLDALAHAHARGVIHRDLKPSNVLCFGEKGADLRLKLADFGLSYALDNQGRSDEGICGTPWYMAPEQVLGNWRDYGPWTDLYALGCLAWELVSDAPIFADRDASGASRAQVEEEPPPLAPRASVPEGFEAWVRTLLRKHPRDRFQFAADAALALFSLPEAAAGEGFRLGLADRPTATKLADLRTIAFLRPNSSGSLAPPEAAHLPMPRGDATAHDPAATPPAPPPTWRRAAEARATMPLVDAGLGLYGLRTIPLVGREEERDALWQALLEVHATRRPLAVLLRGAAGNGKGRLAEWIAERAHEVGAARTLRATHGAVAGPGDGLGRMVARHLGCLGLTRQQAHERIEALLRAEDVHDETEWAGLAEVLEPRGGTGSRLSAVERHDLVLRLLCRATRDRPVVLWLDDVQWGADALGLVSRLLQSEGAPPVLVLATVLDEALGDRTAEAALVADLTARSRTVTVGPLPPGDRAALVRHLLGLQGDLAAEVERRCAGNPLFAVQLVGDWVERRVLVPGESGFVLREGEQALLPDTLHEVWSGRLAHALEGLPAQARDVLEIAAALGLAVDALEWQAACAESGVRPPPGLLERLVVNRLALRTDGGFCFVHGMLRESLERIAREAGRWAQHNRCCARMLEARHAATARGVGERLGRHWLQAGEPALAVVQLLKGARERRETSDYGLAHGLLREREQALRALGAGAGDPRWAEGFLLRARVALHEGRLEQVFRSAREAERAAGEHGWTTLRCESLRLLGDAARRQGDLHGAERLYDACVALGGAQENPHAVAASLWGLGDVLRQRGAARRALELFERSRALYEHINDPHGIADHRIGCADVAWQDRDLAAARRLYGEALDLFQRLGNRYGMARGWNGQGEVARADGDLHGAAGLYRSAEVTLERISSAEAVFPRLNLALLDLAAGRDAEARARLLGARGDLFDLGWHGLLACADVALLACGDGDWDAWDERLASATATLTGSSTAESDVAWCAELAGRKLREASQTERARKAFELARSQQRALGYEPAPS